MNKLSWLIYLAGFCDAFCAVMICLIFVSFGWLGVHAIAADSNHAKPDPLVKKRCLLIAIVAATLAVVLPGKETFYALAASQLGEQALASPIASKASKALEAWLDSKIADSEKKK